MKAFQHCEGRDDVKQSLPEGMTKRGKRILRVRTESGIEKEHLIPQGKHLLVHNGDRVRAGEPVARRREQRLNGLTDVADRARKRGAGAGAQPVLELARCRLS